MDALGHIKPVAIRVPQQASQPVVPSVSSLPVLPAIGSGNDTLFDVQGAEIRRLEEIKAAVRNAPQPLGSQAVTMYKDAAGQVITRFRDTNSGRVTYIPEPDLLRMAEIRAARAESLLNIIA